MKEIFAYISVVCIGAGVPIVLFIKAFDKIEMLTSWAWVGISVVSVVAICCSILILAITRSLKQK